MTRQFPGNMVAEIVPLTYGRARITLGPAGADWYDDGW
jgi:hypothetical protein